MRWINRTQVLSIIKFKRVSLFWAWWDGWIGYYYNREKKILYIGIVPMVLFSIEMRGSNDRQNQSTSRFDC